ncbi:MAG: hypothetical protein Q9182_006704 [Xanthomendoza sp. 2 TL-2023]
MSPSREAESDSESQKPSLTDEISYKGHAYDIVREGLADILNLRPDDPAKSGGTKQSVFYNPVQQFNRDLSVLAIRVFAEDLAIIRRRRHERTLQKLAKGGKKGTKRKKRCEPGAQDDGGLNGNKKSKGAGTLQSLEQSNLPQVPSSTEQSRSRNGPHDGSVNDSREVEIGAAEEEITDLHEQTKELPVENNVTIPSQEASGAAQANRHDVIAPDIDLPFRVLDALSATGLRALRYVKEIPQVTSVTANDLSPAATVSIQLNAEYNGVTNKIQPTTGDAKALMYHTIAHSKNLFHVIDLDPYGTAVPFLDAAVQAVPDGGLLCVTCTDSGIFASVGFLEKTFSQYGGVSWKGTQGHEAGLRLILNAVATSAARYGLAIEPLLSLNIDFYARLFVRIRRSPADVKFLASKTMIVYNCDHGCGSFSTQYMASSREREGKNGDKYHTHSLAQGPPATPFCEHCGFKTHLAGPMWGGPLHNPHFITKILDVLPSLDSKVYGTIPRIEGMLTLALNETLFQEPEKLLPQDSTLDSSIISLDPTLRDPHPFFITPSILARTLHCSIPSDAALRGALIGLGYRITRSHTEAGSVRTDAPWRVIWEIMREWIRQKHPIKEGALTKGMAGWEIMRRDRSRRRLLDTKQRLRDLLGETEDAEMLCMRIETLMYSHNRSTPAADVGKETNLTSHNGGTVDDEFKEFNVVFDEKLGKEAAGKKLVRYQMNPRADWGPMTRAKVEQ